MTSAFVTGRPIIRSLLDTDFYKLTMMQGVHHQYPNAEVTWEFRCRDDEDLAPYVPAIRDEIDALGALRLSQAESSYLKAIRFMTPDFVRFLDLFRFDPGYVRVEMEQGELCIRMTGPWSHVMLFEITILAIISEVRNRLRYPEATVDQAVTRLRGKLAHLRQAYPEPLVASFTLADFGTRRRFSQAVQDALLDVLIDEFPGQFVGTSNVDMARRKGISAMGTMAHEWIMAHQQLGSRLIDHQKTALEAWVQEYRGELGIALTDTITTDAFFRDFDLYFAKLFDGLRHDSGDPLAFAEKCIRHYESLGIDPRSKTLIFSDGLDFDKAMYIKTALEGRIRTSFGVGTNLTCDLPGVKPMNMVIKMVACNGQPVAKISDAPGKTMCPDQGYVHYLKSVFQVKGA